MLFAWLYGCAVFDTHLVSSASIEPSPPPISQVGRLEIGDTVLVIRPNNNIFTGATERILGHSSNFIMVEPRNYKFSSFYCQNTQLNTQDPFVVEILISSGNPDTVFNPMGLVLDDGKGIRGYPARFYTFPPRYSTTRWLNPVTPLCRERGTQSMHMDLPALSRYVSASHEPLPLMKDKLYCFAVQLDIPPIDPRSAFTITVTDLRVHGQKITVPVITYSPDTYKEYLH